jgi:PAS domain S-box-containing protein
VSEDFTPAELAKVRLDSLLAVAPIGIGFLDRSMRFQQVNAALAASHGRSINDHLGRRPSEVSPVGATIFEPVIRRVLETGEPEVELEYQMIVPGSESPRHFVATYSPVRSGSHIIGVALLVCDVTKHKHLEDELRQLAKSREQVLSMVWHDLRSPLSAIQLTSRLLERQLGSEPRGRQNLDIIQRCANRMQRLIDDLADTHAIHSGRLSLHKTTELADDIANECLITNTVLAAEKGVRIEQGGEIDRIPIMCDRRRVLQVLANLIANAIKACRQGDSITVSCRPSDAREVVFCVRDTGVGIAPDLLPGLFEPELSGKQRNGLGLYICKGIIEAHGGRIWVESERGTAVFFTLPVR